MVYNIAFDATGNVYVAGTTQASNFVTANPIQSVFGGGLDDAFVAKLNPTGTALLFSTFLGGNNRDLVQSLAVNAAGDIYVSGFTNSSNFPTTPGAFQGALGGDFDIFFAKIAENRAPVANAGPDQTVECTSPAGASVMLDASASIDPDGDPLTFTWAGSFGTLIGQTITPTLPRGTHIITLMVDDGQGGIANDTVLVIVRDTTPPNLALSTSNITVVVPTASATGATVDLTGVASATDVCDPMVSITNNAPPASFFPIGATTVTFTATDDSGNASSAQLTVQVVYNFIGFLPPIRNDGSSIFLSGRTVPAKFQLTAADGSFVTNATATLAVFKVTDQVTGTVEEITPDAAGSSNTGNLFRFDPDANQYIYNLSTASYTAGTYLLRVSLNDGTMHQATVSVK